MRNYFAEVLLVYKLMEAIGLLFVGWLFGIASPLFVEFVQKPIRRSSIKQSLQIEFRRLRFQLTHSAKLVGAGRGLLTSEIFGNFHRMQKEDRSPLYGESIHEDGDDLLSAKDLDLDSFLRIAINNPRMFMLKKQSVPFLTSNLAQLQLFSPDYQRRSLEVAADLTSINDAIDDVARCLEKTFDTTLNEVNRKSVLTNQESAYRTYFNGVCKVADNIDELLKMKK